MRSSAGRTNNSSCGCAGQHYYASAHRQLASRHRGYRVSDDEVDDQKVARVLRLITARADDATVCADHIAVDVAGRTHVLYLLPRQVTR